jgi:transposase
MYLLSKLTPDFRRDNAKALRNVFRAFVKLCSKLDLYQKTLLAVDGTKIRAQNGDDHAFNKEILEKKLARIEEHISSYLSVLDAADQNETDEKIPSADEIKNILLDLNNRKEKYEGYLDYLSENGKTQILETDPEARRMHSNDGFHCCYNVQTAVDSGSHFIADYEVTNHNTDVLI